jgi:hypothetical protein
MMEDKMIQTAKRGERRANKRKKKPAGKPRMHANARESRERFKQKGTKGTKKAS